MKILRYTFEIPKLIVDDNELLEAGFTNETYTFTLLFKGVDLYEKLTGRALLTDLAKMSNVDESNFTKSIDMDVIKNLAKASYCKIEGDAFHQNMITAEEFSKTQAFSRVATDVDFMTELLSMAVDCCVSNKKVNSTNSTKK